MYVYIYIYIYASGKGYVNLYGAFIYVALSWDTASLFCGHCALFCAVMCADYVRSADLLLNNLDYVRHYVRCLLLMHCVPACLPACQHA